MCTFKYIPSQKDHSQSEELKQHMEQWHENEFRTLLKNMIQVGKQRTTTTTSDNKLKALNMPLQKSVKISPKASANPAKATPV